MSFGNGRTHYFHADATAIGGHIEKPIVKNVPVQSPVSLAPVGGVTDGNGPRFEFENVVSAEATRTRVEGHFLSDLATTRMTSQVDQLIVLNRVRAGQLLAYISSEHPGKDPHVPRVDFGRTSITNLRVDDADIEVLLDLNLLNGKNGAGNGFPKKPHVQDKKLWDKVDQKFNEKNGHLRCSLVKKVNIKGKFPGRLIRPNILEIPDFGRIHLAELIVSYHSYQLIMMRFELGCPTSGALSASAGKVNGSGGGG